jgi:hypothetical protein
MIAGSTVSILYAFSGNGKTSLVNAGIIPFFQEKGYAVFRTRPRPPWCQSNPSLAFEECVLREHWLPDAAADSEAGLADASAELDKLPQEAVEVTRTLLTQLQARFTRVSSTAESRGADLRAYMRGLVGEDLELFVGHLQGLLGREARMLFVCDQFEELFVHFYDTPVMKQFVNQLSTICKLKSLRAQFLFSMREDWVGSMIEFRPSMSDIFSSYFKLAPLRKSKAAYALTLPAKSAGIDMDANLVARILDDLSECYATERREIFSATRLQSSPDEDPFIELPALQIVAEALWKSRTGVRSPFTLEHYESLLKKNPWAPNEAREA